MPTQARWAILGPGNIAHRFAEQLPHSQHGRLHAVGSSDPGRAAAFAAQYQAPVSGDYDTVLADPEVDAVYISTVHTTHAELTLRALDAGKHVICEKPLSPNWGTSMAVADAAQRSGLVLLEAYMYRFHPLIGQVLSAVEQGELGELSHIDASFAFRTGGNSGRLFDPDLAGGGILDVGGYPLHLAQAIARAAGVSGVPQQLTATGSLTEHGIDEWTTAQLTFAQITATVRTGIRINDESRVSIYGTRGALHLPDPWLMRQGASAQLHTVDADVRTLSTDQAYPYAIEADAVVLAAREGRTEVPEFPLSHSLELAQAQDRWRAAIGVRYPFEADDANIPPLRSLRPAAGELTIPTQTVAPMGDVSRLVLGCDNQPNLAQASAMFDAFVAAGGTTFDTAYIYGGGLHERLLGQWLHNRGIREQVTVIVKGAHTPHCDPASIATQLETSLDRLGIERADLYLMHRDDPAVPAGEFVEAMAQLVDAGRISAFGGSNWTVERVTQANEWAQRHGTPGFAALSNHFGLARALDVPWAGCEHVTDDASRQWLTDHQLPLLPWSSQARGFFAGRAHPEDHSDPELVRCYYADDNFERLRRATELAERRGVATTAIALAYVLAQPFPTFPLIGPRTIGELRASMQAVQVELSADEVAWLDLRQG